MPIYKEINPKPLHYIWNAQTIASYQRAWSDNREKSHGNEVHKYSCINSAWKILGKNKREMTDDTAINHVYIFHWKKNAEICPWSRWIAKANRGVLFPHSPNRQNDCWETAPRFLPLAPSPSLSRQKSPHKQANPDHLSQSPWSSSSSLSLYISSFSCG